MSDPGPSSIVPTTTLRFEGGGAAHHDRPVAVEVPVNIVYGTVPYAVMMATPADLKDFAVGFSLTEGIIEARGDIRGIAVVPTPQGIRLSVDLVPHRVQRLLARRRAMTGRTGCGVCGLEDLDALPRAGPRVGRTRPIRLGAIRQALEEISARQPLNEATRAVHAAAWVGCGGGIACVREDVGRHNALDKLVGALLSLDADPQTGFVLLTSRCSYEMVEKAAAFGAGALVAISAPTSLSIERALHHRMTLIGIARWDTVTVFCDPDRLVIEEMETVA